MKPLNMAVIGVTAALLTTWGASTAFSQEGGGGGTSAGGGADIYETRAQLALTRAKAAMSTTALIQDKILHSRWLDALAVASTKLKRSERVRLYDAGVQKAALALPLDGPDHIELNIPYFTEQTMTSDETFVVMVHETGHIARISDHQLLDRMGRELLKEAASLEPQLTVARGAAVCKLQKCKSLDYAADKCEPEQKFLAPKGLDSSDQQQYCYDLALAIARDYEEDLELFFEEGTLTNRYVSWKGPNSGLGGAYVNALTDSSQGIQYGDARKFPFPSPKPCYVAYTPINMTKREFSGACKTETIYARDKEDCGYRSYTHFRVPSQTGEMQGTFSKLDREGFPTGKTKTASIGLTVEIVPEAIIPRMTVNRKTGQAFAEDFMWRRIILERDLFLEYSEAWRDISGIGRPITTWYSCTH